MEISPFSVEVARARARVADLEQAQDSDALDSNALLVAFEELRAAFEELGVAEEGLRDQHDALLEAQESVAAERQRYQELFDFAPDAYLVTDIHGIILETNRAAGALLGVRPALLKGFPIAGFAAPGQQRAFRAQMRDARNSAVAVEWDCALQPRRRAAVQVTVRVTTMRDSAQSPVGLRWLLRDMTERVRAEAAERTLEEEQAARRRAEEVVKEREAVLAVAAHELKTPLSTILGYAQLVRERCLRSGEFARRDADALAIVASQAQRLSSQIDAMLDVGSISTGQFTISPAPLDLVVLGRRVFEALAPTFQQHALRFTHSETSLVVVGDAARLEQLLYNLLGNAAKYSPAGGKIELAISQQDSAACVAVTDQGIGISPADLDRLFERFYRAHGQAAHEIRGLGIGLYVVREIVQAHGGTISVQSREGEGSAFTVCLPLASGVG